MEITWNRSDEAEKAHCTVISDEEILKCASIEEAIDMIYEILQIDFQTLVDPDQLRSNVEEIFRTKEITQPIQH